MFAIYRSKITHEMLFAIAQEKLVRTSKEFLYIFIYFLSESFSKRRFMEQVLSFKR